MPKAAPTRAKAVKSRSSKEEKAPLKIKERKDDQWKASDLLQHAKSLFDRFEFEAAAAFSERAIQTRHATLENTATAYSILTACLLEMGDLEKARERFLEMLKIDGLDVDVRIETLFGLAQLSAGEEALRYYVEGISVGMGNHFVSPDIIASAYASIAELYMTDLCDLAAAEAECEQAIQRALESSNGESLDAHRVAADLRLVQGRSLKSAATRCASRLSPLLLSRPSEWLARIQLRQQLNHTSRSCKALLSKHMHLLYVRRDKMIPHAYGDALNVIPKGFLPRLAGRAK